MVDIFKKKTGAAKAAKKPASAPKKAAAKKASVRVTPEERLKMIQQAAYLRAERAGFTGDPHAHWVAAEKEVDQLLAKRK